MPTPAFLVHLASFVFGALRKNDTNFAHFSAPTVAAAKPITTDPTKATAIISSLTAPHPAPAQSNHKPLRIVHLPEATGIGRMRISGRMADVCAELDRLAALEAA